MKKLISLAILFFFSFNTLFVEFALAESRSAAIARMTARSDYEARPIGLTEYQEWIGTLHDLGVTDYAACTSHLYDVLNLPNSINVMSDSEMYRLAEAEIKAVSIMVGCSESKDDDAESYVNEISSLVANSGNETEEDEDVTQEMVENLLLQIEEQITAMEEYIVFLNNEYSTLGDYIDLTIQKEDAKRKKSKKNVEKTDITTITKETLLNDCPFLGKEKADKIYDYIQNHTKLNFSVLPVSLKVRNYLMKKYRINKTVSLKERRSGDDVKNVYTMNSDELCEKFTISGQEASMFFQAIHLSPFELTPDNIDNIIQQIPFQNPEVFVSELFKDTDSYATPEKKIDGMSIDGDYSFGTQPLTNIDGGVTGSMNLPSQLLDIVNNEYNHYISMQQAVDRLGIEDVSMREQWVLLLESKYGYFPTKKGEFFSSDVADYLTYLTEGVIAITIAALITPLASKILKTKEVVNVQTEELKEMWWSIYTRMQKGEFDKTYFKTVDGEKIWCSQKPALFGSPDEFTVEKYNKYMDFLKEKESLLNQHLSGHVDVADILDMPIYDGAPPLGELLSSWKQSKLDEKDWKSIETMFKNAYKKNQLGMTFGEDPDVYLMHPNEFVDWLYSKTNVPAGGPAINKKAIETFLRRYIKTHPLVAITSLPDLEGGIESVAFDDPFWDYALFEIGRFGEQYNNICESILDVYPPPIR